jgi:hypothetical protein
MPNAFAQEARAVSGVPRMKHEKITIIAKNILLAIVVLL